MDDLDALLLELEATIPSQAKKEEVISPSPKGRNSNGPSTLQGNLTELDSLLEDLYNTDDVPVRAVTPPPPQLPPPAAVESPPPVMIQRKPSVNIDSMLEELEETDMSSSATNNIDSATESQVPAAQQPASVTSAAQQLDDLMASLVGFQLDPRDSTASDKSDPPYAKPDKSRSKTEQPVQVPEEKKSNDLDEMLKQMNTNLDAQGIRAASKGNCGACGKPVMGEATTALGKVWHPEHFVCVVCDEEIGTKTFFERESKPYCENCYHKLFSPACAYCNKPVLGQCVTALNKTWHPEHFFCAMCNNFFGDEGFHEFEGKPYCRPDYYNMFAPKCGGCLKPILTNYISALNQQWHPECFVCRECSAPFTNGSFFELDGQPYCETHYHSLRGSLCSGCQKPITGRCITAMGKKFHPEHFVCAFCLKQLNKGTFKEQNEKPYCHQCFTKLFGKAM